MDDILVHTNIHTYIHRYSDFLVSCRVGGIAVLRYYRDKYVHNNIIASILLAYHDNRTNDNTATTTSIKPLSTVKYSRYRLETSCLQCITTCTLFTRLWFAERQANGLLLTLDTCAIGLR